MLALRRTLSHTTPQSALARSDAWFRAAQVFAEMVEAGSASNTFTYNAAVSSCENGNQWSQVEEPHGMRLPELVRLDIITYSAAINACEKWGPWAKVVGTLA